MSLGQTVSKEELKLVDINNYLVKPVKRSRLFDCLASEAGRGPIYGTGTLNLSPYSSAILRENPAPSEANIRLTSRLGEGAPILQINMLERVIVRQLFERRPDYFNFQERV
jgi:hypothetical protein